MEQSKHTSQQVVPSTWLTRIMLAVLPVLGGFILFAGMARPAQAVPVFARQTGFSCDVCHFQHYPKLTAFGRWFKAHGYSMTAPDKLMPGNPSIANTLSPAFEVKTSYADSTGKAAKPGSFGMEGSLFLGGRLAHGVGGIVEYGGNLVNGKVSYTKNVGPVTVGVTPFMTSEAGAQYGFELLSDGVYKFSRPFLGGGGNSISGGDNPNLNFAQAAEGVAFDLWNPSWFVTYTPFGDTSTGLNPIGLNWSQYVRAAYTPTVGNWDLALGGGKYLGSTTLASGSAAVLSNTNAWFVDAQAQGQLLDHDLGLYAVYANGDAQGANNLFGSASAADVSKSFSASAEYTMIPHYDVVAGYGHDYTGDTASSFDSYTVGFDFTPSENIQIIPSFTTYAGDGRPMDNQSSILFWTMF